MWKRAILTELLVGAGLILAFLPIILFQNNSYGVLGLFLIVVPKFHQNVASLDNWVRSIERIRRKK